VTAPLPDAVRSRVVGLVADALGRMEPEQLPASLKRVAAFTPARRARLAGTQIAGVVARDETFRERVAVQVRAEVPELARALYDREDAEHGEPAGVDGHAAPAKHWDHGSPGSWRPRPSS
jgi:hypothetical protein